MSLVFLGIISEISEVKKGKTKNDEDWASLDFEVVESNPANVNYPQIALFSFFKTGEYVKYVTEFGFKVGDEVEVEFNLKRNVYKKKDGSEGRFYKTDCWRLQKVDVKTMDVQGAEVVASDLEADDDMPF